MKQDLWESLRNSNARWDEIAEDTQQLIIRRYAYTKASPSPVALRTTTLPEPILYEKDGWGIYGNGAVHAENDRNGHTLTHIGCDCDYPNWAMSQYIWNRDENYNGFSCTECKTVLSKEAYIEFCKVYNFINNVKL
jgi:hypothetical protein